MECYQADQSFFRQIKQVMYINGYYNFSLSFKARVFIRINAEHGETPNY